MSPIWNQSEQAIKMFRVDVKSKKNDFLYCIFFIDLVFRSEYKCLYVSLTTFFPVLNKKIYFIRIPLHSNKYLNREMVVYNLFLVRATIPKSLLSLKWIMFVNSDSYNPLWTANDDRENCEVYVPLSRSLFTRGFILSVFLFYITCSCHNFFLKFENPIVVQLKLTALHK